MTEFEDITITTKKFAYHIPISCCLAADYGVEGVECNHPKPPPPTRRQRLRWWLSGQWNQRPRIHLGPCECDCYGDD